MSKIHTTENVWKVWNWCIEAYGKHGQTLRFPKETNPTKTYQWRYAVRITKQLEEWEFDDNTSITFIRHVVGHIKKYGLLHKGLSAFFQSNIIDICYGRMNCEYEEVNRWLALLRLNHGFLSARANGKLLVDVLLSRPAPDSYYNIVDWFERNRLSIIYMAISRSCTMALSQLSTISSEQRILLPSNAELFCLLNNLTDNVAFKRQAVSILRDDWRAL